MDTPESPSPIASNSRLGWIAFLISLVLIACLCGLAVGSILISAGISTYAGLSGSEVTVEIVTAVSGVRLTQTPYPTYTFQPTYTLLPTYTQPPTPEPALIAPTMPAIVITATLPPAAVQPTAAPALVQNIDHIVESGETLQSIAQKYGVNDLIPIIYANELDRQNPEVAPGETLTIPAAIHEFCAPANAAVLAEVSSVVDGDTIEVSIGEQNSQVSYIGIDAPEGGDNPEPLASAALNANLNLVGGKTVALIADGTTAPVENELPRYVIADKVFVNYEMVRQGYAQASSTPPDDSCADLFTLAADQAKEEGSGIWALGLIQPTQQTTPGTTTPTLPQVTPAPPTNTPFPSLTPTSTSSLGFTCHCGGANTVYGNFYNEAQANVCRGICEIAAARRQAACATAAASGSVGSVACR